MAVLGIGLLEEGACLDQWWAQTIRGLGVMVRTIHGVHGGFCTPTGISRFQTFPL